MKLKDKIAKSCEKQDIFKIIVTVNGLDHESRRCYYISNC